MQNETAIKYPAIIHNKLKNTTKRNLKQILFCSEINYKLSFSVNRALNIFERVFLVKIDEILISKDSIGNLIKSEFLTDYLRIKSVWK